MPVLLLRESDVRALVSMTDALAAVEASLLEQAHGAGINNPRRRVRQPNGVLHVMSAALPQLGYWGVKTYTTTAQGARFLVSLYDSTSGALLSLIEADTLGQLRTGAASGIATRCLANPTARVLALFGSGYQAETQLEAISTVHPLESVRVFSRNQTHAKEFADRMAQVLDLKVHVASSPELALDGADLITTITSAVAPLFDGNLIQPGTHINAAGSNSLIRAELDAAAIRRASLITTDDPETARLESGNLTQAFERNTFNWGSLVRLADVVAGLHPGRRTQADITLFESHGIALWDIALAGIVYERARLAGLGQFIEFGA